MVTMLNRLCSRERSYGHSDWGSEGKRCPIFQKETNNVQKKSLIFKIFINCKYNEVK